jgi:hypothetical protein
MMNNPVEFLQGSVVSAEDLNFVRFLLDFNHTCTQGVGACTSFAHQASCGTSDQNYFVVVASGLGVISTALSANNRLYVTCLMVDRNRRQTLM